VTRPNKKLSSWFRPWLDGLGDWPTQELDDEDAGRMQETLQAAGQQAVDRLNAMFGAVSEGFGADSVARSMAVLPNDRVQALALARAATSLDYHFYRASPPRPEPGGLTNPSNRSVWQDLEPHIKRRLPALLATGAADSIVWRTIFNRIPRDWVRASTIERALERQFAGSDAFVSVHVETDLRPPETGGEAWIAEHTERSLAEIESQLKAHRPCLVELIRGTVRSPTAADAVVVYALQRKGESAIRLACYDPRVGDGRLDLAVEKSDTGFHFRESGRPDDLPSVKALRVWRFEPATPPLFGLRRHLDSLLPWRLFWGVRRAVALAIAVMRGRE